MRNLLLFSLTLLVIIVGCMGNASSYKSILSNSAEYDTNPNYGITVGITSINGKNNNLKVEVNLVQISEWSVFDTVEVKVEVENVSLSKVSEVSNFLPGDYNQQFVLNKVPSLNKLGMELTLCFSNKTGQKKENIIVIPITVIVNKNSMSLNKAQYGASYSEFDLNGLKTQTGTVIKLK